MLKRIGCGVAVAATIHLVIEETMRAETESVVNDIRESLSLLRRHL